MNTVNNRQPWSQTLLIKYIFFAKQNYKKNILQTSKNSKWINKKIWSKVHQYRGVDSEVSGTRGVYSGVSGTRGVDS